MGNKKLYKSFLERFLKNNVNFAADLTSAFENFDNDPELPVRMAHTLKGLAGNIGANDIQLAAKELEADLRTTSGENLNSLLRNVQEKLNVVFDSIETRLLSKDHDSTDSDFEKSDVLHELTALGKLLDDFDSEAGKKLVEIGDIPGFENKTAGLREKINNYEFEEASGLLRNIIKEMEKQDSAQLKNKP